MSEGDYVDEMIMDQAEIDKEQNEMEGTQMSEENFGGTPVCSLLNESMIYDNPCNVNNLSRSAKCLLDESGHANTERDGNMWAFVSRADGPMFSAKCKEQIMVLNYITETMPHRRRLLRTASLIPTFDSEDVMTNLVERIVLSNDELDIIEGTRDDIGGMRVDRIPLEKICDFRNGYNGVGYTEKSVKLGEILVCPVCTKYSIADAEQTMVFWLVIYKARRCFDFSGHVSDIISTQVFFCSLFFTCFGCITTMFFQEKEATNGKRKGFVNKDLEKMVELIRNILLYQYKMSPNADNYLREEGAIHVDPFDRMLDIAAPDSIDAICNIYEMFRSILTMLPEGYCLYFYTCLGVQLQVRVQ
jgi:hypothetical protein